MQVAVFSHYPELANWCEYYKNLVFYYTRKGFDYPVRTLRIIMGTDFIATDN